MKYLNAKDVLPEELVRELQQHVAGAYLYVPVGERKHWGEVSGYRRELSRRNRAIIEAYRHGASVEALAEWYALAESTIRNIIYHT